MFCTSFKQVDDSERDARASRGNARKLFHTSHVFQVQPRYRGVVVMLGFGAVLGRNPIHTRSCRVCAVALRRYARSPHSCPQAVGARKICHGEGVGAAVVPKSQCAALRNRSLTPCLSGFDGKANATESTFPAGIEYQMNFGVAQAEMAVLIFCVRRKRERHAKGRQAHK